MTGKNLTISHDDTTDTLSLYTELRSSEGEDVAPDLSVHYNRDGEVMLVVIQHAAKMLGPHLFPDDERIGQPNPFSEAREMAVAYAPESDTLRLQTGDPPYVGYTEKTVAPGLFVNFDPDGWAMGVRLERAAARLRPYLRPAASLVVERTNDVAAGVRPGA